MFYPLIEKTLMSFFHELNERGIRYAVLRKVERIPEKVGNDVDILIIDREAVFVRKVIRDCAERFKLRIYERRDVSGLYIIFYAFVDGALIFLRLDFTNPVPNSEELLERRMKNEKGIYFLPEGLFEKKPKGHLKNVLTYPWRLLFPSGKFLVFVGPDGVGKSTTAELLAQLFGAFHIPVEHMHLGFRPKILPTRKDLFSLGRGRSPIPGERSKTPGLVRFLYHTLDYILGYFFKIRPFLIRGCYVIGERYYYNYLIDPRPKAELGFPNWLAQFLYFFIPKPDVVILLSHDPTTVFKRRQEHSREEIERQISTYRKLGKRVGQFFEVRTDVSPEDVVLEIAKRLRIID